MNIEDAVLRAAEMSDNAALVARPPLTWGAEAIFADLDDDYGVPKYLREAGYVYLLGKEDLLQLISFTGDKRLSSKSVAEFVIHYALTDAYPSWFDDISSN
ncbi:MAG: hypothetical protein JWQ01_2549 [Massilia sp.]|nr:hypothetical protein [Massilia sp.]